MGRLGLRLLVEGPGVKRKEGSARLSGQVGRRLPGPVGTFPTGVALERQRGSVDPSCTGCESARQLVALSLGATQPLFFVFVPLLCRWIFFFLLKLLLKSKLVIRSR